MSLYLIRSHKKSRKNKNHTMWRSKDKLLSNNWWGLSFKQEWAGQGIRGTNIELFCLCFYRHPSWLKLSRPSHSTGIYTPSILIPVSTLVLFVKSRVLIWNDGAVMQTTIMPCSSALMNNCSLINLVRQTLISVQSPQLPCGGMSWGLTELE